jgi:hypothetical protein
VTGISSSGSFIVTFDAYGSQEEIEKDAIKPKNIQEPTQSGEYKGIFSACHVQLRGRSECMRQQLLVRFDDVELLAQMFSPDRSHF